MFQSIFYKIIEKFTKKESTKFSKIFTTSLLIIGLIVLIIAFIIILKNGSLIGEE